MKSSTKTLKRFLFIALPILISLLLILAIPLLIHYENRAQENRAATLVYMEQYPHSRDVYYTHDFNIYANGKPENFNITVDERTFYACYITSEYVYGFLYPKPDDKKTVICRYDRALESTEEICSIEGITSNIYMQNETDVYYKQSGTVYVFHADTGVTEVCGFQAVNGAKNESDYFKCSKIGEATYEFIDKSTGNIKSVNVSDIAILPEEPFGYLSDRYSFDFWSVYIVSDKIYLQYVFDYSFIVTYEYDFETEAAALEDWVFIYDCTSFKTHFAIE